MNAIGNSADPCAVCYGALEGGSNGWFPYSLFPAFIRRLLRDDSVLMLKPCGHKFHFACINQWLNLSHRCPLDRRIITGCDPPSLLSINLQQILFNAIECNRIEDVQDILLTGLTPEQLSQLDQKNPLTMASVNGRWEIAGQLLRAGWTTEDKVALAHLGWMYREGRAIERDFTIALLCYRKSADQGYAPAQNGLGWMYEDGLGVEQDDTRACFWYHKAAVQGYSPAQDSLGWMYEYGFGVGQDYTEAFFWYHKSAVLGFDRAQKNLGRMYEKGLGVKQDYAEALSWYGKAAAKGNRTAQVNLRRLQLKGLGGAYTEALCDAERP